MKATTTILALLTLSAGSAFAAGVGQLGILDTSANGGVNPNTGVAWAIGDTYRLAFHTDGTIDGTSNDPAVYDNFATTQAQSSTLGNGAITTLTGWTAMVWVNTDSGVDQGLALSDPSARSGITGGPDGPVYAMDGTTSIAQNNAVVLSGTWASPFANVDSGWGPNGQPAGSSMRLPVGATSAPNTQNVFYSPFLDQFGAGDSGSQHGRDIWVGGFPASHVNAVGEVLMANGATADELTGSRGSSNANNSGRVWNRFTDGLGSQRGVYAISPVLTVVIPEPSTGLLGLIGGLFLLRRRRK